MNLIHWLWNFTEINKQEIKMRTEENRKKQIKTEKLFWEQFVELCLLQQL